MFAFCYAQSFHQVTSEYTICKSERLDLVVFNSQLLALSVIETFSRICVTFNILVIICYPETFVR